MGPSGCTITSTAKINVLKTKIFTPQSPSGLLYLEKKGLKKPLISAFKANSACGFLKLHFF